MSDEKRTMKALVKRQPVEGYELLDVPIPKPAAGEILIKVERVSICGSDINLYKWNDVAKTIASLPFTPGHECVGVVAERGEGVDEKAYPTGARVCVENHFYCGVCYQCTHDLPHICQNMGQFGHGKKTIYGGFSQYSILQAKFAYVLKTKITPVQACLLEPFGVAHHAVEEVEVKGDTLLITGCGPIGLLCISVAKAMGAKLIIVTDVVEERLAIAKKIGADVLINSGKDDVLKRVMEATNNDGVGALIEASGATYVVNNCFTFLRKGGRILMLGLPKAPIHVENPLPNFIFKSITLKTIHGRKIFHTWEQAEKLVADGKCDVDVVVSHEFGLDEFDKAHKILIAGEGCKIVVDPQKFAH